MNNDYSQQYPQMYNAMYSPYQQQQYTTGGEDFKRVTTTTRKNTQPVVVSREDLINALKTGTNDYKKALAENNTLAAALGKSISDKEVENTLAAPTNKGRLESEISPLQAFVGGTLAGFNTYGKMSQNAEDAAAKQYDATMKGISTEDALLSKQEAADLQNALNNQTISVTGYEKYKLPKDDGKSGGIEALRPLDSTLGERIRENPDAFGFTARVADMATNGELSKMATSSIAKGLQGDKNLAARGQLLQEVSQVVGAVTALQRVGGTAAGMMNSDTEGKRALGILSNPSEHDSETLAAAVDTATKMYDNALRFSGKYEQVYGIQPGQEQAFPTGAQTKIPVAQQKANYAGTKIDGGYAW